MKRKPTNYIVLFAILLWGQTIISCTKKTEEPLYVPDAPGITIKSIHPKYTAHQQWTKNATMYEANIRDQTPEGTFKAFKSRLPALKNMGVSVIWLMPINPIGQLKKIDPLGSPYSVRNYKDVNPDYGTMNDFKELVMAVHDLGMFITIDWVANHTSWDNSLTQTNPAFYVKDGSGNFTPPPGQGWSDVIQLNYQNQDLRNYMIEAMKFWVTETDVDGFRCDAASLVPLSFWSQATTELKKLYPGIFMLAEGEDIGLHNSGFDMTYAFSLHGFNNGLMKAVYQGTKNANDLGAFLLKELASYTPNMYRLYFTSNHDESASFGSEFEQFGKSADAFAILTHTLYGMPLLYNGQEVGLNKRLSFFTKDLIDFTPGAYTAFYTKLNALKANNSAVWNGTEGGLPSRVVTSNQTQVFAYKRDKNMDGVLVFLNLSANPVTISVQQDLVGTYINTFTGAQRTFTNGTADITLDAWGYLLFEKKK
jgi:cyclomaltodextrinase